ncbi:MAG: class I SAM-dependent DNA methyltransferase [Flavobacterium sp.]|nr:class I SAM-dependent DNA methyltransferase [Flavobacterium sp.]
MIIFITFSFKKCPIIQSAINEHYKIRKSTQTFLLWVFYFIILTLKKENPKADTSVLENDIDDLVYQLYDLTPEEIKIVQSS